MSDELKKIFEKDGTKKVSLNVNKELLNIVDSMAKIFEMNRSQIMFSLLKFGIKEQTSMTEDMWDFWLKKEKFPSKKELIQKKLKDLKSFKKKWDIENILD